MEETEKESREGDETWAWSEDAPCDNDWGWESHASSIPVASVAKETK